MVSRHKPNVLYSSPCNYTISSLKNGSAILKQNDEKCRDNLLNQIVNHPASYLCIAVEQGQLKSLIALYSTLALASLSVNCLRWLYIEVSDSPLTLLFEDCPNRHTNLEPLGCLSRI